MSYSTRFDQALTYASELHRDQIRKGNEVPYVTHLMGVASLVGANGGDEDQVVAALLHDAIEDGDDPDEIRRTIGERFGDRVLSIVDDCTDADDHAEVSWSTRKHHYLTHLRELDDDAPAVLISLADKLHNARSILRDVRREGEAVWQRFRAGRGGVRWYYGQLLEIFQSKRAGWLVDELERAVTGIEDEIERLDRLELSDSERLAADLGERLEEGIQLIDMVETVTAESDRHGGFIAYVVPGTLTVRASLLVAPENEITDLETDDGRAFEEAARERLETTWPAWQKAGFEPYDDPHFDRARPTLFETTLAYRQPVTLEADDLDEVARTITWLDEHLVERV